MSFQSPDSVRAATAITLADAPQWAKDSADRALEGCLETWELAQLIGDLETVRDCRDFAARRLRGWHQAPWLAIPPPDSREVGESFDDWLVRIFP